MALCKTITKDNGITTSYHKVTSVTVNQDPSFTETSRQLSVKLTSYLNQEYRENNQPIENQMFYFSITFFVS